MRATWTRWPGTWPGSPACRRSSASSRPTCPTPGTPAPRTGSWRRSSAACCGASRNCPCGTENDEGPATMAGPSSFVASAVLAADHHGVEVAQRRLRGRGEAGGGGVFHHLGGGVLRTAVGHQQHVQADHQVLHVPRLVVEHAVVYDERAAVVDRPERLGDQVA